MSKSRFTNADEAFRRLLKQERKAQRLTQAELAVRLGQPQSFVSKYELGERRLDFVETLLVCEALDIDPASFTAKLCAQLGKTRRKKDE